MSKVLEQPVAAVESVPAGPSFQDRVNALTGPAREHWKMEGDIDAAEALNAPKEIDVTPASSPGTAEGSKESANEPAPAPGVEDEQPKTGETPEQKSERKHRNDARRWDKLTRESASNKARADLLEKQLADRAASAPAKPEVKAEEKPSSTRPDFPNLEDYPTVKDFNEAVKKWKAADEAWLDARLEQREQQRAEQFKFKSASEKWETIKTSGRTEFKDFDAVAFNPKVPASLTAIVELQSREDGHQLMYYLGKHPEIAAELATATDIPGEFKTYAELKAAARKDPDLALLVGEKRGIAKAEIALIAKSLKSKAAPAKETIARQPKPSGEVAVEANAAPVEDELADAIKRKDQGAYNRIMNKREMAEQGRLTDGVDHARNPR